MTQSDKSEQKEPKVKLNQLLHTFRYEFLAEGSNQHVIVNASLGEFKIAQLLTILKNTQKSI